MTSLYNTKNENSLEVFKIAYKSVAKQLDKELTTKQQLLQVLQRSGKNPSFKQVNDIWIKYEDGISFKETRNVARVLPDISRKQLLNAFKKIDINGDGFITDTELYKVLTSRGEKMTYSEVRKILANADQNKDGKLDYIEFCDMMLRTTSKLKSISIKEKEEISSDEASTIIRRNRSRPPSAAGSVKSPRKSVAGSRKTSIASRMSEMRDQPRFEVGDDNLVSVRLPPPLKTRQTINPPASTKGWSKVERKGSYFVDGENIVTSHLYELTLNNASSVWITLEADELKDGGFFIYKISDEKDDELVSLSQAKHNGKWCWSGDLRKGKYKLTPFVTGCYLQYKEEDCDDVKLTRENVIGEVQLTKKFKGVLNDLFEMCDIDGDGRLSREEFNLFQQVTSDEDVDDEAWEIVTENVEMDDEKITRQGFQHLHLMQAREEGVDPQEELMDSLLAYGYSPSLNLDNALAFTLSVHSKDSHPLLEVTEISNVESDLINKGFVQTVISKGQQVDIGDKIKWSLYKDAYRVSMAVQNENIRPAILSCELTEAENTVTKRGEETYTVEIPAQSSMVVSLLIKIETHFSVLSTNCIFSF